MAGAHLEAQARRVVVGVDADGKSTIAQDDVTATRLAGPGNTKCDIWRLEHVPATLTGADGLNGRVITPPPPAGLVYRITTFPPDAEWDRSLGYSDANGQLPGSVRPEAAGGIPGMHATDTFDFLTVVSGELYLILETGETLLRPGDSLVMRGQLHAWSNRTDKTATVVSVLISAEPSREEALEPLSEGRVH
jgi:quercetin dioxygenase-like cupin family protein